MMERVRQKIGRIKEYLSLVRSMKDHCFERFNSDPIYRGAIIHYLYLMADSCIALAELTIKHKNLRPPQSYREAFDILGENNILDRDFADSFGNIAGFRNFLAHDYEQLDAQVICKEIMDKLNEVEIFITQIENLVSA